MKMINPEDLISYRFKNDISYNSFVSLIKRMPTIDAVPVVRCKDCEFSKPWYRDKSRCFLWHEDGIAVFNDGFCSYGRKDDVEHESAQPERKTGRWIENTVVQGTTSGGTTVEHQYTCSECGALMGRKGDAYCYKCGAKMDLEAEDG